jgi:ubiquinone/menaquinone biosynthesis C-methylase UbiE
MTGSFDKYACAYSEEVERSISFIGQKHDFFMQAKVDAILEVARDLLGAPETLRLLDVGCGVGLASELLAPAVGSVSGVDVSESTVAQARLRCPETEFDAYDGCTLPYDDSSFDVAFAICVLHHVPPDDWSTFVPELARVVRSDGLVMILEHNPYNPLTRLAVSRCAFDEDAHLISRSKTVRLLRQSGLSIADRRDILFVPWYRPALRKLEAKLAPVPAGAQYLVAGRVR